MPAWSDRMGVALSRGFFVGHSPLVPGTAGTLAAIPLYLLLALWTGWIGYTICTLVVIAVAVWSSGIAARALSQVDPRSVIIDEVAGFLVTMAGHPLSWKMVVAGFFLFRLFDVWKPPPLRRLEKLHGGLGIVADDLGAGVYANLCLVLGAWWFNRFF
ncbi:MAG: phosphatidylglycerophosphatase A [Acidobacteriota bacterium]